MTRTATPGDAPRLIGELGAFATALGPTAPASAALLAGLARDIRDGGAVGRTLLGHPERTQPLFGLRALAGLHRLMVDGSAPELAARFRAALRSPGTPPSADGLWSAARDVLLRHPAVIEAALREPVQQHQPQRAAVLQDGLCLLGGGRVRLLELGACAGLGLLPDHYRWYGPAGEWGPASSPVRLPAGPRSRPGAYEIVERAGCDLAPRDPADPVDTAVLRSFLPPEHTEDLTLLEAALEVAAAERPRVDRAPAADWLREELARPVDPDVLTVVWHSLVWHYLPPVERIRVDQVLSGYAENGHRAARIALEPEAWSGPVHLRLTLY